MRGLKVPEALQSVRVVRVDKVADYLHQPLLARAPIPIVRVWEIAGV